MKLVICTNSKCKYITEINHNSNINYILNGVIKTSDYKIIMATYYEPRTGFDIIEYWVRLYNDARNEKISIYTTDTLIFQKYIEHKLYIKLRVAINFRILQYT